MAARAQGMSYEQLCLHLLATATLDSDCHLLASGSLTVYCAAAHPLWMSTS